MSRAFFKNINKSILKTFLVKHIISFKKLQYYLCFKSFLVHPRKSIKFKTTKKFYIYKNLI